MVNRSPLAQPQLSGIIPKTTTKGQERMDKHVRRMAAELFGKAKTQDQAPITEADLAGLPEPLQRYLIQTGVIGRPRVSTVRLKQEGFFRTKPGQKWMPLRAVQYYSVDPPAFLWHGKVKMLPFLSIQARDRFDAGTGHMLIKLLPFTLGDVRGPELDQGALLRYFNEMMWFPTAFLSECIQWDGLDANTVRGTIRIGETSASAVMHFTDTGQFADFVAERYMESGGAFSLETWSTPTGDYAEMNGLRLPVSGEGVWHLSAGDFSYIRVRIAELEYDTPLPY
jgi:hypothetical protein